MEQIIIKNLSKSYGTLTVLKNVDLTLDRYKTYCLMSPSGTGKTTLFRILMGLEKADEGDIIWNVGSGAGTETDTDASRSLRISAVFQEDRLCPSFSPLENVMMVQKKHASEISGIFLYLRYQIKMPSSAGRMFKPAGIYLKRRYETADCHPAGSSYQVGSAFNG